MTMKKAAVLAAALVAYALFFSTTSSATNGMFLTAYGAESAGRGGVNLAISDRVLALNFNPAGISQLQGNHYSVNMSVLAPSLDSQNMINASTDAEDTFFPLPAIAYVRGGQRLSWGIGFFAQGGMGATFEDLNTFFGTRDETYTEVRYMTLSPTVAYAPSDDMSFGLTFNLGYADASFSFFPDTSFFNVDNPQMSFFGVDMTRAGGLQTSLRAGWWWRAHPRFQLGAVYQTETSSDFENGDMWVNFGGHPFLGERVLYNADMEGFTFTFAAQAGLGFAYRAGNRWLVGLDVKRYFWDDAIDTITVRAGNPDTPFAPPEVVMPFVFDWKDQWVYAIGADYKVNDRLTVRGGFNHGDNPVPSETLTPLFPATVENHLCVGASWLRGAYTWEFAVERGFGTSQVNDNLDPMVNPFGPGLEVGHEQWTVSIGISRAWSRNR